MHDRKEDMMNLQKILRPLGMELLGWMICSAGVFAGFLLQFVGAMNFSLFFSGSLPSEHQSVSPVWFGAGAALCFICFAVVWRLMLRKTLDEILHLERAWLLVWILLAMKSLAEQIALFWFISLMMIGIFRVMLPAWITGFVVVYLFYVIIFILVDMLLHIRQTK